MDRWDWAKIVEWLLGIALITYFGFLFFSMVHAQNKCEDSGGRYIARAYECVYEREAPK